MTELKRSLGLAETTLMGVGVMLGAGIYALVGEAAARAGNAVWLSFLLASLVAGCTGLSYAELSSFIPKAGGQYYYASRAFGQLVAFFVSWLLVFGVAIAAAAVALGFGGYLLPLTGLHSVLTACLLVVVTAGLLIYGIQQSAWVAGVCTVLEVLGLAVVVAVGIPEWGSVNYLEPGPEGIAGVISAGALIFFAYIGFEEIVQLSEESRNPRKNIPRAVLLSIAITTVIYVVVALSAVSVLDWEQLGKSEAPLADVVAKIHGQKAFVALSVIALFSTANTVLILLMSAARLVYGMAEDAKLPISLARIHRTRHSPYLATIAVSSVSILMIVCLQNLADVANLTNFTLLAAFAVVNLAVIALRYREPGAERPFKVPGSIGKFPLIPLFGVVTSIFMLSHVGSKTILVGLAVAVIGLPIYLIPFGPKSPGPEPRGEGHRSEDEPGPE